MKKYSSLTNRFLIIGKFHFVSFSSSCCRTWVTFGNGASINCTTTVDGFGVGFWNMLKKTAMLDVDSLLVVEFSLELTMQGLSSSSCVGNLLVWEPWCELEFSSISTTSSFASNRSASSSFVLARRQAPGRNIGAIGPETAEEKKDFLKGLSRPCLFATGLSSKHWTNSRKLFVIFFVLENLFFHGKVVSV